MMGDSLRRDWTARDEFVKTVESRAKEGKCTFRALVLEPSADSPITRQRMIEENDAEEIRGRDTSFLQVFAAEFERMWELGAEWPQPIATGQTNEEG